MQQIAQSIQQHDNHTTDHRTDQSSDDSSHAPRPAESTSIASQFSIRSSMTPGPVIGRRRLEL